MVQVTCSKVFRGDDGKFFVELESGQGLEYGSLDAVKQDISQLDSGQNGIDTAIRLLLGWWLARSPDASNENLIEGKTLVFDLSNPNPIRVQ